MSPIAQSDPYSESLPEAPSWAEDMADRMVGRYGEMVFAGSQALSRARAALLNGATVNRPGDVEWDVSGDCTDAFTLFSHEVARDRWGEFRSEMHARRLGGTMLAALARAGVMADHDAVIVRVKPRAIGMKLTVHVRCRKCEKCKRARQFHWVHRARNEIASAERTWFATLTMRPALHRVVIDLARRAGDRKVNDFDALPPAQRFNELAKVGGQYVTRWLKRVRKQSGTTFRYLSIVEQHSLALKGLPHWHLLLHENSGPIGERVWRGQWRHNGVCEFTLVDPLDAKAPFYATKYLTKSALVRVRASLQYGLCQERSVKNGIPKAAATGENRIVQGTQTEAPPVQSGALGSFALEEAVNADQ